MQRLKSLTYPTVFSSYFKIIPPLTIPALLKDGKLESDFKIKANYFSNCYASQRTPLVNDSKLPDKITDYSAPRLTLIKFDISDILKIIRSLSSTKCIDMICISWT